MKNDKYFISALEKAIRHNGGQKGLARKVGLSQSTISYWLRGKSITIFGESKKKILPALKEFFPEKLPIEKWLAESESTYLSAEDIRPKEFREEQENLSESEKLMVTLYRLLDSENKLEIMESIRSKAINTLSGLELKEDS